VKTDADEPLVIVTGAASGIGRAIADDFQDHGWSVGMVDLRPVPAHELGPRRVAVECDVRDEAAIAGAFRVLGERFERPPWACFANAGQSGGSDSFLDVTVERFRHLVDVNLIGTFLTMREAARAMIGHGGRIVAVASIAGIGGRLSTGVPYAAAKAGIINMVQQAAVRLAGAGITVNAIAPGPIETDIGGGAMHDPAVAAAMAADVPMGRVGQPREILPVARMLVERDAAFITGQVIAVDGGALVFGGGRAPRHAEPVVRDAANEVR
jgi:NAD(P)-dependent dehydrogenase (short-subunit alcohol dehydrogenase family)